MVGRREGREGRVDEWWEGGKEGRMSGGKEGRKGREGG